MDKIELKKTEILGTALNIFANKGYHSAKISDIAAAMNMGHGTFYRYFKDKLDVFSSVIDKIVSEILTVLIKEDPSLSNNLNEYREQLKRIGEGMFKVFLKDEKIAKLIFYVALGIDDQINSKINRSFALFDEYTEKYLINGEKKGFLKQNLNTLNLSKAINAMIFGAIKDTLNSKTPEETFSNWLESISLLMLEGMAS
ncbi:MAG: TetR/AcrR family transcriptional regulator [Desulfobacterales bacterium]|nr:TetR/AcrR family transcriptional regulator [Desulfobacterales bacterium]